MKSLATDSPAWSAQEPEMNEGMTSLLPLVESTFKLFKSYPVNI